uniref:Putative stigma-specific STIG1-like protein 3 n=1 Tax=Davidia involucrata TaxID=16924 RepID=A0A5B7AGL4_DAVIN
MKLSKLFFILIITITIFVPSYANETNNDHLNMPSDYKLPEIEETTTSFRGLSRFLAQQNLPSNYTCDKFPRVCRLKGSAGADCNSNDSNIPLRSTHAEDCFCPISDDHLRRRL